MVMLQEDSMAAYRALHEGLAVASGADRGALLLEGGDSTDFLQRILSSDLRTLRPGGGQWSAMLDGKGKWIADLLVYRREDGGRNDGGRADGAVPRFLLDTPAALADTVSRTFDRMHFGEALAWLRDGSERLLALGPDAREALAATGTPVPLAPPEAQASGAGLAHAESEDGEMHVLQRGDRGVPCWEVFADRERAAALRAALVAGGAVEADASVLETARIEAGIARYGRDFGPDDTLPESGEWHRASIRKGCYSGQEVVAKVHTYGEAPWQLCRLAFTGTEAPLQGRALLDAGGTTVGKVNSWAWSPMRSQAIGLGRLRRKVARNGLVLRIEAEPEDAAALVTVPEKILG